MNAATLNLDQKAAQYAQKIVASGMQAKDAKTVENLITKTLGVLQEQGVYAMVLFLFSRSSDEKNVSDKIRPHLYELLGELPGFKEKEALQGLNEKTSSENVLKFYSDDICSDLDTLLLIRDLYEQTLIYARFGAKAEGK